MPEISDEMLMAYADGALEDAERTRIAGRLASDPVLRRRLAVFERTAPKAIGELYAPIAEVELPERLFHVLTREMVREASARSEPARGPLRGLVAWMQGFLPRGSSPLAAALALAASMSALTYAGHWAASRVPASDPFRIALETARSSSSIHFRTQDGLRTITPVMTFEDKDGRYCRHYILDRAGLMRLAGVACRTEAGEWQINLETEAGRSTGKRHVTAGVPEALQERIDALIKGAALGPKDEDALLKTEWKRHAN